MDEIPGLNLIPEKYRGLALFLLAISPYISRGYHAIATGGGLRGIISAIWLGTNTPTDSHTKTDTLTTKEVVVVTTKDEPK